MHLGELRNDPQYYHRQDQSREYDLSDEHHCRCILADLLECVQVPWAIGAVIMGVFVYKEKATSLRMFLILMIVAGIAGLNLTAGGA